MSSLTMPVIIIVILFGCSCTKKAEKPIITSEQKAKIELFSNKLINSLTDLISQ